MNSPLLKKKAMDALLETMSDANYESMGGHLRGEEFIPEGKGTEPDSNHTEQVVIPAADLHQAPDIATAEFFKEGQPDGPIEEEMQEHEFFKEAPEFEVSASGIKRVTAKGDSPEWDIYAKILHKFGYRWLGRVSDGSELWGRGAGERFTYYPATKTWKHSIDNIVDLEGTFDELEDKISLYHGYKRGAKLASLEKVFENENGFITDFGQEQQMTQDGAVVGSIPRYGVWQVDPVKHRPQVTHTSNDLEECKEKLVVAKVASTTCDCGHAMSIHTQPPDFGCPHEKDGCGCKGANAKTAAFKSCVACECGGCIEHDPITREEQDLLNKQGKVADVTTKSYGMDQPIGGTPNPDAGDDDQNATNDENTEFALTSAFEKDATNYMEMFSSILKSPVGDEFKTDIQDEVNWAKKTLKKQDRVTWWLRWYRLYVESRSKALAAMLVADLEAYNKKAPVFKKDIPGVGTGTGLEDYHRYFEHLAGMKDHALVSKIFGFETPKQIQDEMMDIEQQIAESAKRTIPQEGYEKYPTSTPVKDEPLIKFPNGWVWMLLDRAYCPQEADAMGHCGNQPRDDSSDQILSLREPIEKGGKKFWSPHCTFILRNGGFLGEMKGRANAKPVKRYHPYIIALLKDPRIKGIMGGGYNPKNNFHWSDLTTEQQEEIKKANPAFGSEDNWIAAGKTPEVLNRMAMSMGLIEDDDDEAPYSVEADAFIIRSWRDFKDMCRDIGNAEALEAAEYAMNEAYTGDVLDAKPGGYEDTTSDEDKVDIISGKLGYRGARNLQAMLERTDSNFVKEFTDAQLRNSPNFKLDLTERDQLRSIMDYMRRVNQTSDAWEMVNQAFRGASNVKYRENRIGDLENAIGYEMAERRDSMMWTELRYGPDFSNTLQWDATPIREVISYEMAVKLLSSDEDAKDMSKGQAEIYVNEYYDHDDDEEMGEAIDVFERLLADGLKRPHDEDQMKMKFQSSLLNKKKALVQMHESPTMLPPRDDMKRHLDETEKDEAMEGVMDGVAAPKRRRPNQINPNVNPLGVAASKKETKTDCPKCKGKGHGHGWTNHGMAMKPCSECNGSGKITKKADDEGYDQGQDEADEYFLDQVAEARDEAKRAFMQEDYMKELCNDYTPPISMEELWKKIGDEFTAEFYGVPYKRVEDFTDAGQGGGEEATRIGSKRAVSAR